VATTAPGLAKATAPHSRVTWVKRGISSTHVKEGKRSLLRRATAPNNLVAGVVRPECVSFTRECFGRLTVSFDTLKGVFQ
jgi:hypothetical protein